MRPHNVEAYRKAARRRLPRAVFDFVEGGAQGEETLRAERGCFESIRLIPKVLVDTSAADLSTTVCGQRIAIPLILSPIGVMGMSHSDGELGAARAAARRGTFAIQSAAATYTIEETARAVSPPPWYQMYPFGGRSQHEAQIQRAQVAGMPGLCITVDGTGNGVRERDVINRLTVPPTLTMSNATDILRRPRWIADAVSHRRTSARLTPDARGPRLRDMVGAGQLMSERAKNFPTTALTWEDLDWLRGVWKGPLAVKGVLDPDDARRAVAAGVDALIVSTHGGRAQDGVIPALEALPAVVAAASGEADVILDGGIRRGSDALKALCLGARACMVGRAWAYALAADGERGVYDVIGLLADEMQAGLASLGRTSVDQLDVTALAGAWNRPSINATVALRNDGADKNTRTGRKQKRV